jgi:putative membrane protein
VRIARVVAGVHITSRTPSVAVACCTAGALAGVVPVRTAAAHAVGAIGPDALWRTWNVDPLVLVSLFLALCLYARGVRHLWTRAGRGRGVTQAQVLAFALGVSALVVALMSPLDPLGGTLLTAHMGQHALLVAIPPPLLLLGRPGVAFAWSLRAEQRPRVHGAPPWRFLIGGFDALARPLPAGVLHGLALWMWHAPAAFDAALAHHVVHALEHAALFGTALLFWRAILDARLGRRVGQALGANLATLVHGGLLGALITLAPSPLYRWYRGRSALWGLTALEDQQLAGLLVWVPMNAIYLAAGLALAGRVIADRGAPSVPAASVPLVTR